MQTLCLRGRHSQGGDWSAKWNMFAFQIHTVKQHSLHLFKTLVMSFNTTSRLPLLPPHVSLLVDNASGHFVLYCTTLPVNFQRNARLTLWKLWMLSKIITGDEHLNWHATKILIVWSTKVDENLQKINLMSYSLFVKRSGICEDTVVLLYTVKWYCSWGFGGNMSANEATVRVVKLPVTQMDTVWL